MFMTRVRKLQQDAKGSTAVEFAFIAPLLLMMLAGMAQFGMGYFVRNHMQDVARETSRQFAIGALNEAQAESYAQSSLLNLGINYPVAVVPPVGGSEDVTTSISAPMAEVTPFDFLGMFQNGTMQVAVTMRTET